MISLDEFKRFFKYVPSVSIQHVTNFWLDVANVDSGTDLSPPVTSPHVPWFYFIFGGIAGIISRTLTAPMEQVKLKAQTGGVNIRIVDDIRST